MLWFDFDLLVLEKLWSTTTRGWLIALFFENLLYLDRKDLGSDLLILIKFALF